MQDNNTPEAFRILWENRDFWGLILLMLTGAFGRALMAEEPFDARRFGGEALLSCIGAVVVFLGGFLAERSPVETLLIGALISLGGIHAWVWAFRIFKLVVNKLP